MNKPMTIDAHAHISVSREALDGAWSSLDTLPENLLEQMDIGNISKAVLLPIDPFLPTKWVQDAFDEYPDRFIPFFSFDYSGSEQQIISRIEELDSTGVFKGAKLHPRLQSIDLGDTKLTRICTHIASFGYPILMDCLPYGPQLLKDTLPLRYEPLLKAVPHGNFILAHAGGIRFMDMMLMARTNPNVWIDTSRIIDYFANSPFSDQVLFALEKIGADKIIFGSDFPETSPAKSYTLLEEFLDPSKVLSDNRSKIMNKNILSLLKR
ncbi:MAG: amidohydrolase family protein [Candidatus Thorarchaeota archaeon]|nr:amidohydrolase family protein [Candidatus Thorarchaeota archaeon]